MKRRYALGLDAIYMPRPAGTRGNVVLNLDPMPAWNGNKPRILMSPEERRRQDAVKRGPRSRGKEGE